MYRRVNVSKARQKIARETLVASVTTDKVIKISRWTTVLSFLFGTAFVLIYYITYNSLILFLGYGYILLAGIVNIIFISILNTQDKKNVLDKKRIFKTTLFMLVNIPIALIYCYFILILMNTTRLTLVNNSDTKLTDLNIVGCQSKKIPELNAGEEKEIWIRIYNDCQIDVSYNKGGQVIKETAVGYCTNGAGEKVKYVLGTTKKKRH